MTIEIVKKQIKKSDLAAIASKGFGEFVKAVVDIKQEIMVVGGELHADEEVILMEQHGAKRENTWGINYLSQKIPTRMD